MLTEKQIQERRLGIGGSDTHHLLNERPYGCQRSLWYDKRGTEPDYPLITTGIMERGNDLELFVAKFYRKSTGRMIRRHQTRVHSKYDWARANVDRQIIGVKDKDGPGILECKTSGREMFYKIKSEGLPIGYLLQLQWYLWITGYSWGSYAILWPDAWYPDGFLYFDYDRDDELIALLEEAGSRFWRAVENGPTPSRLDPGDKRCSKCSFRTQCQGLALLQSVESNGEIDVDNSIKDTVELVVEAKELQAEAALLLKNRKSELMDLVGSRQAVDCDGYRVHAKPIVANRFNTKLFKSEHPDDYEQYLAESVSRPLKIYAK
jgi:predicted phage-related endonuclease